ncbi:hypothetical protein SANTM175S_06440 [Streptomyces antimycoticus]
MPGASTSQFADLAELERHAREIRVAVVIHIPALLQTVDHARAVLREAAPPLRAYEVERRLSYRMKRQAILHEGRPVSFTAIIHEAALRMEFGGVRTVRAQLEHVIAMGELDNINVRVIHQRRRDLPWDRAIGSIMCLAPCRSWTRCSSTQLTGVSSSTR